MDALLVVDFAVEASANRCGESGGLWRVVTTSGGVMRAMVTAA